MDLAFESSYPTPYANTTILPLLLLSLATQKNAPNTKTTFNKEYDYIVVGGGAAGSVAAARLSEIPCVTVLLLEAGFAPPLLTDVPALARAFWLTNVDWQYKTVPQKHTGRGLVNNQVIWPSGKGLGGSSIFNAMLYVRGNKRNYDHWSAEGATGWSYQEVLPYFKKMEDNQDPQFVDDGFHGVGGPITVMQPRYTSEIKNPIIEASESLGYEVVDSNGYLQTGIYDLQATERDGQRCSAAKAYLVPAENRTNLDIVAEAFVRKIVIRRNRAMGVQFDFQGTTYEVAAKREVIMAAGTTNTAQLLQLSGVGPAKLLKKFNIPIKADLPVGENLQDHCLAFSPFTLGPQVPNVMQKLADPANVDQYIKNRTGALTATEFISIIEFLNGASVAPVVDFPNHELFFIEVPIEIIQPQVGLTPEVFQQVFQPYENSTIYACASQILQPRSKGTVQIQSTNPYDPPLIDPNYFDDPRDIDDVVEGLKTCVTIGTSAPLLELGSTPFATLVNGCEDLALELELYLECVVRTIIVTANHQVGTAKMGDPSDPTTVVDPQLRVKGISGLRIVDASVMPIIPSGNTYAPTMMVAEKASDMIKATIQCQ